MSEAGLCLRHEFRHPFKRKTNATMSNFSDREDRAMVQLVAAYQLDGRRVSWIAIEQAMKRTSVSTKCANHLRMRFKTLTNRFGRDVSVFPLRYRASPIPSAVSSSDRGLRASIVARCDGSATVETTPMAPAVARCDMPASVEATPLAQAKPSTLAFEPLRACQEKSAANENLLMCFNMMLAGAAPRLIADATIDEAMLKILGSVEKSTVRQPTGRRDENVGELSVSAVKQMIGAIKLTPDDVFLDVGCGLGNIAIQVALQTTAKKSVGVDMRQDVAEFGKRMVLRHWTSFPGLQRVFLFVGDVRVLNLAEDVRTQDTTVLYCHNTVFATASNLAIRRVCCDLKSLRAVVLAAVLCPRHRVSCYDEFCTMWSLTNTLKAEVTYKSREVDLYVYERSGVF